MPGTTHARPRSRSRSATISWRTHGRCSATSNASSEWAVAHLDVAARRRARSPRRRSALDPGRGGRAARVRSGRSTTRSTPCRDRDFVQEFLADAAICATHLSRLAADLARWTDRALGWAELDEAYTTGSSMMPQKRNPDTAELARAKAARIAAGFAALTSVLQGLPLGYHRDLQEDKEPAFDAADTLELVLPALVGRRRDRAVRRRGDARGRVGRGALRHRPRGGARPRRGAVPRGAPPDRASC